MKSWSRRSTFSPFYTVVFRFHGSAMEGPWHVMETKIWIWSRSKKISLSSILCSKGCHYQFLATEMDFGGWCLVCHLPELEGGIQLGPLRKGYPIRKAPLVSPYLETRGPFLLISGIPLIPEGLYQTTLGGLARMTTDLLN